MNFKKNGINIHRAIPFIKAIATYHAQLLDNGRQTKEIANHLRFLIKALVDHIDNKQRKHSLDLAEVNMMHWLRLYGHFVLNIPGIHCPTLVEEHNPEVITSGFQNTITERLCQELPEFTFFVEWRLKNTGLTADIFCKPNIVIEVDGKPFHYCDFLPLRGRIPKRGSKDSVENGKTTLKRVLLQHANYQVFNINSKDDATIEKLVKELRSAEVTKGVQVLSREKTIQNNDPNDYSESAVITPSLLIIHQ